MCSDVIRIECPANRLFEKQQYLNAEVKPDRAPPADRPAYLLVFFEPERDDPLDRAGEFRLDFPPEPLPLWTVAFVPLELFAPLEIREGVALRVFPPLVTREVVSLCAFPPRADLVEMPFESRVLVPVRFRVDRVRSEPAYRSVRERPFV